MDKKSKKQRIPFQKGKNYSYSDKVVSCMRKVREDGNTMVIKLDGARSVHMSQYTVLIGFPKDRGRYPLRQNANTLEEACSGVMKQYLMKKD